MSGRVAEACTAKACGTLLVRGDQISFVSVERERQTGAFPLDDKRMPSDITLPAPYVLVNDTTGTLFDVCHFYIVRWHNGGTKLGNQDSEALGHAREYYGESSRIRSGSVDIPKGPWHRVAKVKYIRYRRTGQYSAKYEHTYEIPVELQVCRQPLAFRIPLPQGCVVDERGFVWP